MQERFDLVPRRNRDLIAGALAFPVLAALGFFVVAVENAGTTPILVPISVVLVLAAVIGAWWWMKRTGPIELTVDGEELVLVDRGREQEVRGRRTGLRGERGYVAPSGRMTGGVRYPAIAFVVGERRIVAMASEPGPTVTQRALHGTVYTLPPERFTRLAQLLRLT